MSLTWIKSEGKRLLRQLTYRSGGLGTYHQLRNSSALTVVGIHRVLGDDDPRWREATPAYTISLSLFENYVEFFANHYNVVSSDQVLESRLGHARLPERSLLITFDDGWSDTAEYALPVLERAGLPSTVFVVSDAIGRSHGFWQEAWYGAWATGRLDAETIRAAWAAVGAEPPEPLESETALVELIEHLEETDEELRSTLLPAPASDSTMAAAMASVEQVRQMNRGTMRVGSHGKTHARLTMADDLESELVESRSRLAEVLETDRRDLDAIAFPHGRYDEHVVDRARAAGYELIFTCDFCLNATDRGRVLSDVFGRVFPDTSSTTLESGQFSPDSLANLMFRPPIEKLTGIPPQAG